MKADPLTIGTLVAGACAFVVEWMYLARIAPLQADLGIQVSGGLLALWACLVIAVFARKGWRAWWILAVTSPALIGPASFVALIAGCAFFGACL
jgi:hypothetical protein